MVEPTDKWQTPKFEQGVITTYENRFAHLKDEKISLFEIGVWKGDSLRWFKEFFSHPETKIIGIDTQPENLLHKPDDSFIFKVCDQNDSAGLSQIGLEHGPFDIIIDDGCHHGKETYNCFVTLWPFVKPGGWYVIEDWDPVPSMMTECVLKIVASLRDYYGAYTGWGISEFTMYPVSYSGHPRGTGLAFIQKDKDVPVTWPGLRSDQ